jgi:hypothetical protein
MVYILLLFLLINGCLAIDNTVLTFWFGKPMTGVRLEAFENLKRNIGASVILITSDNLNEYNITSDPIHKG